jgi:hypothetical protein
MISHPDFPGLTADNHRVTSPATSDYNCIAWSAHDTGRWWQPGVHWPVEVPPDDYGLGVLERAFLELRYEPCDDGSLEPGFEKVALYGSVFMYTHAARQLSSGKWTSKLGQGEDIEHDTPEDVAGWLYGEVAGYMKRRLEDRG